MMTALLGNGVKTIIIEKLDRLARDLMVQEAILLPAFLLQLLFRPEIVRDPVDILIA
jgi:hypothetical protein